jgi:hypothetical protein
VDSSRGACSMAHSRGRVGEPVHKGLDAGDMNPLEQDYRSWPLKLVLWVRHLTHATIEIIAAEEIA